MPALGIKIIVPILDFFSMYLQIIDWYFKIDTYRYFEVIVERVLSDF